MSTVFEKLLSGEWPCAKVYEDELVFAFMDAGQVNDGHVIVATKAPRETLLDCSDDEAAALMRAARRIAIAVQAAFAPEGITVLQANKAAGWQTVPHLHLHVLPRFAGDGVELTWPRKEPGLERLRELAARLRPGLKALPAACGYPCRPAHGQPPHHRHRIGHQLVARALALARRPARLRRGAGAGRGLCADGLLP